MELIPSIVAEMLAGTDLSQLTNKEMQAVPFDYIRQVCMLPLTNASESGAAGAEETAEQEAIVAENAMLQASFKQWITKRYL